MDIDNLDDFDFAMITNALKDKASEDGIISAHDIRKCIDKVFKKCGYWDVLFHQEFQEKMSNIKEASVTSLLKWKLQNPKFIAIINLLELLEHVGIIEFHSNNKKHGYNNVKYKVLDSRSLIEEIQDRYPWLAQGLQGQEVGHNVF